MIFCLRYFVKIYFAVDITKMVHLYFHMNVPYWYTIHSVGTLFWLFLQKTSKLENLCKLIFSPAGGAHFFCKRHHSHRTQSHSSSKWHIRSLGSIPPYATPLGSGFNSASFHYVQMKQEDSASPESDIMIEHFD